MAELNIGVEEKIKLEKLFPKADVVRMVSKHSPLYYGNIYPIDAKYKPLLGVFFYFDNEKVYTYHDGFVWIAPEDRIYMKIMNVLTLTESGRIRIEGGIEYYFGVEKI